ncbi:MAG: prenyltransferase, partial [Verrucomicrobiota bacterium]|nr:prenyltransferase [Verrucomicrobiota bacterium]
MTREIKSRSKVNGRRAFLKAAGVGAVSTLSPLSYVFAANEKTADELINESARKAIDKGLRFLSGRQIQRGADKGAFGASGYAGSVGICGLGGLAFMSEGSTPGVGRFGKQVDLCMEFLMRHTGPTGYIARGSGAIGNMYAHGFAMLCMSQAYGMSRKRELGQKLRSAIKCTLAAQNDQGGWRYRPVKSDADLSVTVCQIMALRAARDSGINVPDDAREKCIDYVKKSQTA